jgi:cobalt-zinc-cadmium efflux system membrane fusion protein
LDAPNDPLCQVDQLRIRFLDPSIARKAGIAAEPAATRRISAAVECPGEVQFDQTRLAHLTPRVHGVITEVRADIGQSVTPGNV